MTTPDAVRNDLARIWKRLHDRIDRKVERLIQSRVVVTPEGTTAIVRTGNPADPGDWRIPLAYGLQVQPGDTILTVPIGGRETGVLILGRTT